MKKVLALIALILIVVSIVFGVKTAFKNAKEADEQKAKLLASAVYLPNGEYSEENDGKIVVVNGTIELLEPFVDPLTAVKLPGIRANRTVEQYVALPKTSSDDETEFKWKTLGFTTDEMSQEEKSCSLFARCKIGDLELDRSMLKAIGTTKRYTDFDSNAVREMGYSGNNPASIKLNEDKYYISRSQKDWATGYGSYNSAIRISYKIMPDDKPMEFTFVGLQENGKIIPQDYLKTSYEGSLTLEEVKETR